MHWAEFSKTLTRSSTSLVSFPSSLIGSTYYALTLMVSCGACARLSANLSCGEMTSVLASGFGWSKSCGGLKQRTPRATS